MNAGSLNDPPGLDGLAHLCEHMLFLGTEDFPEENHYKQFVKVHGGTTNAATSENATYYFFDIKNAAFISALEVFSAFFKNPLFSKNAVDREMKAVDSEFRKNLSNENRRLYQLYKSVFVRKGSALNRFSTGNISTLK